jgi:hypothetical protein
MEVLRTAVPPSRCCQRVPRTGLSQRWTGCPQSDGKLLFPGAEFGTITAGIWAFAAQTRPGLNWQADGVAAKSVQRNGTAP